MADDKIVDVFDRGNYKERAFRGASFDALRAAADFLENSNDIEPRTISVLEITAERWHVAVFYKEIE